MGREVGAEPAARAVPQRSRRAGHYRRAGRLTRMSGRSATTLDLSDPAQGMPFGLLSVIEIPPHLEIKPEPGRRSEEAAEPECGAGRDAAAPPHQLVHALEGNVNAFRKILLCQAHRLEELFEEHLPRMGRLSMRRDANHQAPRQSDGQWESTISTEAGPSSVQEKQIRN